MKKFNFVVDQDKILFADNIEDMAEIVKAMNIIVKGLNNENAYYYDWIDIVPDEATDDDFKDIAENDEIMTDTLKRFKYIIAKYFKFKS